MKDDQLQTDLLHLKLSYFREHHQTLAKEAAEKVRRWGDVVNWSR